MNYNGYESKTIYHHDLFTPCRHVLSTNPNDDVNMSPVIGGFFVATQSMHNAQVLADTNEYNKYV